MFFIWGAGRARKNTGVFVKNTCDRCGTTKNIDIIKDYAYGSIFFIHIIKFNKKYFLVCPNCGSFKQISKQEFKQIKESNKNSLVYKKSDIVITQKPVETIKNVKTAEKNEIIKQIKHLIAKLKEKNYVVTAEKLPKFKPVLKEQLLTKFNNEKLIDETIEEYFKTNI